MSSRRPSDLLAFRIIALWELFCHIDKDQDMQLTAEELQSALSKAGESKWRHSGSLNVPERLTHINFF